MESVVPRSAGNGIRPSVQTDLQAKAQTGRNGIRPILIEMDLKTDTREEMELVHAQLCREQTGIKPSFYTEREIKFGRVYNKIYTETQNRAERVSNSGRVWVHICRETNLISCPNVHRHKQKWNQAGVGQVRPQERISESGRDRVRLSRQNLTESGRVVVQIHRKKNGFTAASGHHRLLDAEEKT